MEVEGSTWELAERPLPLSLRPWVRRLVAYEETAPQLAARRELPSSTVVVILNFGPSFLVENPLGAGAAATHGSFVAGLTDSPVAVSSQGCAHCIQIDLSPLGAYRFFGMPMHELTGRITSLEDAVGRGADVLLQRLAETPSGVARLGALEVFLRTRIGTGGSPAPEVARVWAALSGARGSRRVSALASEVGWSRKHLHRRFRDEVGLPPKTMAQVLRFEAACEALTTCERGGIASLAQRCGYADQAHLSREFRRFSGWTPREYLAHRPVQPEAARMSH